MDPGLNKPFFFFLRDNQGNLNNDWTFNDTEKVFFSDEKTYYVQVYFFQVLLF